MGLLALIERPLLRENIGEKMIDIAAHGAVFVVFPLCQKEVEIPLGVILGEAENIRVFLHFLKLLR